MCACLGHFARDCTNDDGGYNRGGRGGDRGGDRSGDRGGRNNNSRSKSRTKLLKQTVFPSEPKNEYFRMNCRSVLQVPQEWSFRERMSRS